MTSAAHLKRTSRGDIQIVEFVDRRLVDQDLVERVGGHLREVAATSGAGRVLLDFRNVDSLSSALLGVLIEINNTVRQRGGELHLSNLDPEVRKIFSLTRLHKVMPVHETASAALEQLQG